LFEPRAAALRAAVARDARGSATTVISVPLACSRSVL
jgi:hypothetical protein